MKTSTRLKILKSLQAKPPAETTQAAVEPIPGSSWELQKNGRYWRLYRPGNVPYFFLGKWTKSQAIAIAQVVEFAYQTGGDDVRDQIKSVLGLAGGS